MDMTLQHGSRKIERVILACVQCRGRHVKCDATQPVCNRCRRDEKECDYKKSRRGGLDKAALERRRLRLQQEVNCAKEYLDPRQESTTSRSRSHTDSAGSCIDAIHIPETPPVDNSPTFQVNTDRLRELFFENFWPSFPIVIPDHYLQQRSVSYNHGMEELLLVLQYIGSIYAPWTSSVPYFEAVLRRMSSQKLPHTPFVVQALMLFALARYHFNMKAEGQKWLNLAVSIALELRMNEQGFAQAYGESNTVLEESWRRTYYLLYFADQNLAIVSNSAIYTLANVPNTVDLPCDDEHYMTGQIPPVLVWQDYEDREFAEVEIVFSSIVYLYDMAKVVASIMNIFVETGTFGEAIIERCDTKLAIWTSLLPTSKRDPLKRDGSVDEVMFAAHMNAVILIITTHRPFSSLSLSAEEMTTQAFLCPTPYVAPPKQGRGGHTARTLRAIEMHTKLLAIPCALERHNAFTMCMSAQVAAAQISACTHLLEDHALSIARDRVRLSIGFLNAMGSFWPLAKLMAKEVRRIARKQLINKQSTITMAPGPAGEVDLPRDELIWPVDPSAQIDIYSGLMLPVDWTTTVFSYPSAASFNIS